MSKIKNGGLDQYGAGPFEQQQFGTAGVEGVKLIRVIEQPELLVGLFFAIYADNTTRNPFQVRSPNGDQKQIETDTVIGSPI